MLGISRDDSPRTWKYGLPFGLFILLIFAAFKFADENMDGASILCALFGFLFLLIGGTNYWKLLTDQFMKLFKERREALAVTPRGEILKMARGISPDVVHAVFGEQTKRWRLVSGTQSKNRKPYSVLNARPVVTLEFFVYFLRNSAGEKYMPMHDYVSDKDHSFDPDGKITSYEMYRAVESLLMEEMKCSRPYGDNKPGYWIGEWDARSVGLDYGIDIDELEEKAMPVEETPAMQKLRSGSNGRGVVGEINARTFDGLEQTAQMKARFAKSN